MADKLSLIAQKAVVFNSVSGLPDVYPRIEMHLPVEYNKAEEFIKYIGIHNIIKDSVRFKVLPNGIDVWYLMYDSYLDKIYLKSGKTGFLPTNTLYSPCINNFNDITTNEIIPFEDIKFYLNYTIDL